MLRCLFLKLKNLFSKQTQYIHDYTTENSCNEIDYLDYSVTTKKELWMR